MIEWVTGTGVKKDAGEEEKVRQGKENGVEEGETKKGEYEKRGW